MTPVPSDNAPPALSTDEVEAWRRRIRAETFANYAFEMGNALLTTGETACAIDQLHRALDFLPTHTGARLSLMTAFQSLGRDGDAQVIDSAGRQLDPCFQGRMDILRGLARLKDQDAGGAEGYLAQARTVLPHPWRDLADAQMALAEQWLKDGSFGQALCAFQQAALDDGDVSRLREAGRCLSEYGAFGQAEAVLSDYCRQCPEDGEGPFWTGFSILAQGRVEDAVHHLRRACEMLRDTAVFPWVEAGLALALLSIDAVQEASRLIPESPSTDTLLPMWMAWALARIRTGHPEDVIVGITRYSASQSLSHLPQDNRLQAIVALCRLTLGNIGEAEAMAVKAAQASDGDDFCNLVKAIIEAGMDRVPQARETLLVARKKQPNYVEAHVPLLKSTVPATASGLKKLSL